MSNVIDFAAFARPDPEELDREGLLALLKDLRQQVAALDEEEPEDMESDAYQQWGELHEDLEDSIDEILERLDELE